MKNLDEIRALAQRNPALWTHSECATLARAVLELLPVVEAADVHYQSRHAIYGKLAEVHAMQCGICKAVAALPRGPRETETTK